MKTYLKYLSFVLAVVLVGCTQEVTPPTPVAVVRTYPVNPTVSAMNISIGGKDFNIEINKDGWEGRTLRSWRAKAGVPTYIEHFHTFGKNTGEGTNRIGTMFSIRSPKMPIIDPEDTSFQFAKSYNYPALLNFFKKGNYPLEVNLQEEYVFDGFAMMVSQTDYSDISGSNSFGYITEGVSQKGSKWELIKIEEVYGQGFYATFAIDCKTKASKDGKVERMVGTIQLLYWYKPFEM